MTLKPITFMACAAAAVLTTAAATFIGVVLQKAEVATALERLDQQVSADFSQNVRLAALLSGHREVQTALEPPESPAESPHGLGRLVVETGRMAILVADAEGAIVASGARNPEDTPILTALPQKVHRTLAANRLSRRFLHTKDHGWLFETGRQVRGSGRAARGFVLSYFPLSDLAQTWSARSDNLRLENNAGEILYAHAHFGPQIWAPLRASNISLVHGTRLVVERNSRVLVGYAATGLAYGLVLTAASLLGLLSIQRRRALTAAKLKSQADNAAELDALVAERTHALREEAAEHKRTAVALQESQSQLVQTAKIKGLNDMAVGLSHELAQPLFALEAGLDTLQCQMPKRSGDAQASLEKVRSISRRMGLILGSLKRFARKDDTPPVLADLTQPVSAALEMLEHKAARNGIRVIHQRPAEPPMGLCAPIRLQQVIVNLVSNSFDAVAQEGSGRVQVSYHPGPQIRITDNGPGFSDAETALTPFVTTKQDQNGIGLGLPISEGIMRNFGGRLEISTGPQGGACITLSFTPGKEA